MTKDHEAPEKDGYAVLRIEDDDGFVTEWPWPDDRLLIANSDFLGMFEAAHEAHRAEAHKPSQGTTDG